VLYFGNPVSEEVRQAMREGIIGYIDTPAQGNKRIENVQWCADNGCFSSKWESSHWWKWLNKQERTMRFAVCPDVVSDWTATQRLFDEWAPKMRAEGFPVAICAQDGARPSEIPWDEIDCVFIGGSTEWKLSSNTEEIISLANRNGTWAHIGRVNSYKRLRWARDIGANSADGTMLVFNPTERLADLKRWLRRLEDSHPLPLAGVQS
jgi:hypothetical protein